jgi:hypothetical protein
MKIGDFQEMAGDLLAREFGRLRKGFVIIHEPFSLHPRTRGIGVRCRPLLADTCGVSPHARAKDKVFVIIHGHLILKPAPNLPAG